MKVTRRIMDRAESESIVAFYFGRDAATGSASGRSYWNFAVKNEANVCTLSLPYSHAISMQMLPLESSAMGKVDHSLENVTLAA